MFASKLAALLLASTLLLSAGAAETRSLLRSSSDGAGESGASGSGSEAEGPKLASDFFKPDVIKRGTLQAELAGNPSGEIEKGVTAEGKDKGDIEAGTTGASGAGGAAKAAPGSSGASGKSSGSSSDCSGSGSNSEHVTIVKEVDTKSGFETPEDALLKSQKKHV
jgi:hypothetical protein